ncbi:MAG: Hsp33 family molecular chaperone HslO [Zoogloeaceae bacterium]|jgi:molecular chaperone Hsp33|nr:Hsp33 family molecular chaperone HslO [Zoogloeaceae bacterium]
MSGVTRFLFEALDIRGAFVRLSDCWQELLAGRAYGATESGLLGEMSAVTALIAAQLKQPGRLTFQLRGEGTVSRLVVDCDEQLRLKAMARAEAGLLPAPVPRLLGAERGGQLMLSLDLPTARQPYQSFVPLEGDTVAAIFQHWLEQSEQQSAALFTAADSQAAACLFLQKLPDADTRDPDGWTRVTQLAATVKPEELRTLEAHALLSRLFHEEIEHGGGIRIFEARPVSRAPANREKVADTLLALGRPAVDAILEEHGIVHIRDDLCNRDYLFTRQDIEILFTPSPRQ